MRNQTRETMKMEERMRCQIRQTTEKNIIIFTWPLRIKKSCFHLNDRRKKYFLYETNLSFTIH